MPLNLIWELLSKNLLPTGHVDLGRRVSQLYCCRKQCFKVSKHFCVSVQAFLSWTLTSSRRQRKLSWLKRFARGPGPVLPSLNFHSRTPRQYGQAPSKSARVMLDIARGHPSRWHPLSRSTLTLSSTPRGVPCECVVEGVFLHHMEVQAGV
jgi:hypothetical protein